MNFLKFIEYSLLIFIAPTPSNTQTILGYTCKDVRINGTIPNDKWYYSRGKGACNLVDLHTFDDYESHLKAFQVVFTFQVNKNL